MKGLYLCLENTVKYQQRKIGVFYPSKLIDNLHWYLRQTGRLVEAILRHRWYRKAVPAKTWNLGLVLLRFYLAIFWIFFNCPQDPFFKPDEAPLIKWKEKFFTMRVVRHWNKLHSKAEAPPSLQKALSSIGQGPEQQHPTSKLALLPAGLDQMPSKGSTQSV